MATSRKEDLELSVDRGLNEREALVLRSLDKAIGLYRGLPELTDTELRTLRATDHILRDMLCARGVGRETGRRDRTGTSAPS